MGFVKTNWIQGVAPPSMSATNLNRLEQAIDDLYNKVAFKVYRNAAFSVSDGTQLQMDAAEYDPDNLYKLVAPNQFSFVCPRAGLWEFIAQYIMAGTPGALDTDFAVRFWKNGTGSGQWYDGPRWPNRGTAGITAMHTALIPLAVNDTVSPFAWVSAAIAASAINVGSNAAGMPTWFAGRQVRVT